MRGRLGGPGGRGHDRRFLPILKTATTKSADTAKAVHGVEIFPRRGIDMALRRRAITEYIRLGPIPNHLYTVPLSDIPVP